jgi:hypothetical protein
MTLGRIIHEIASEEQASPVAANGPLPYQSSIRSNSSNRSKRLNGLNNLNVLNQFGAGLLFDLHSVAVLPRCKNNSG